MNGRGRDRCQVLARVAAGSVPSAVSFGTGRRIKWQALVCFPTAGRYCCLEPVRFCSRQGGCLKLSSMAGLHTLRLSSSPWRFPTKSPGEWGWPSRLVDCSHAAAASARLLILRNHLRMPEGSRTFAGQLNQYSLTLWSLWHGLLASVQPAFQLMPPPSQAT